MQSSVVTNDNSAARRITATMKFHTANTVPLCPTNVAKRDRLTKKQAWASMKESAKDPSCAVRVVSRSEIVQDDGAVLTRIITFVDGTGPQGRFTETITFVGDVQVSKSLILRDGLTKTKAYIDFHTQGLGSGCTSYSNILSEGDATPTLVSGAGILSRGRRDEVSRVLKKNRDWMSDLLSDEVQVDIAKKAMFDGGRQGKTDLYLTSTFTWDFPEILQEDEGDTKAKELLTLTQQLVQHTAEDIHRRSVNVTGKSGNSGKGAIRSLLGIH